MNLTLLKAEECFVAWIDDDYVQTGENLTILFGRLSRELKEEDEPVTAVISMEYRGKTYLPFSSDETKRTKEQLALFNIKLAGPAMAREAPN